ncbi:MAG TPA: hypothetical protein QGH10_01425, partial [Armatimonadota bacterium]|nr:hypothetical protein [Armatimonadota bacterium]
ITDGVGRTAQSSIMVTVFNAPPPTIGINAPADGDTVMGRLDVVVQGTASPAPVNIDVTMGGMMRSVAAIFGTVTFDTTQLANGQHAITATITDGVGRTATTSINVTVDNPAAPTIFIDAPNDGQNVRGPMEVTVIGTATDPLTIDITFGGLTRRITVAIGSVSFDTTQVANGSHAVTATITDNVGQAATHSINVTVDN